ncbi:MAG TPA: alkaline shock response membrane anchor protein AmaP [Syntrophomonadaceae bacterium]|nr:alkaline shock response membrane anchor protein AmaP [Syntrophomonadaceae bacterium]
MSAWWRVVIILYNLVLVLLAAVGIAAAMGRPEPLYYINLILSTPENRVIMGTVAVALLLVGLTALISALKSEDPALNSIMVDSTLSGEISITVPAVNIIIMKAVKKVQGVRDIRPTVFNGTDGLLVKLHMMINPDYSVPEMCKEIQETVKQYLEETGGLKVSEVRVLVDDFAGSNRSTRA